ncbi:MAG TPA: trypsin-like peptidase domain-containing protein [Candidatus Dormibacteraeota bacterium]
MPRAAVALVLIGALVSAAVAAGVTLTILQLQSRTNPQVVNLGSKVTLTEDSAVQQVATRALPAVVSIVTDERGQSYGSGFTVTTDGYIVTNLAVVANSGTLTVLLPNDSHRRDARIVDFDCQTGVAVLKVDQVSNLPTLTFGDSSQLRIGQTVVALGGPYGTLAFAKGEVGSLHRATTIAGNVPRSSATYADTLQTDAVVDTGNSGGPVLNVAGQVVGISVALLNGGQQSSFALASNDVQPAVQQIVQGGQLVVPDLGVETQDLSVEDAALRGLPVGSLVTAVTAGSPAEAAGLRVGDVITQLDDNRLDAGHPLTQVLRAHYRPDQRATVTFTRGSGSISTQATLRGVHPPCR